MHIGGKNVAEFWDSLKNLQDFEKTRKRDPGWILSKSQDSILIIRLLSGDIDLVIDELIDEQEEEPEV